MVKCLREGFGISNYRPGHIQGFHKYVGNWKKGRKDGQGKMFYSNGEILAGLWDQNLKPQNGTLVFDNNSTYANFEGSFKYNNQESIKFASGIFFWKDGCKCKGNFENDFFYGECSHSSKRINVSAQFVNEILQEKDNGVVSWTNETDCFGNVKNEACKKFVVWL